MEIVYVDVLPEVKPFLTMHILRSNNKFALVDPGPLRAVDNAIDALRKMNVDLEKVEYVLLTHIHIDHAGGVGKLLDFLPNAKVVMHERGVKHMVDPSYLWEKTLEVLKDLAEYYGEIQRISKERIIIGKDEEVLLLGNEEIRVMETPGHASHHLVYFIPSNKAIFTGDAAGVYVESWDVLWLTTPMPFNPSKALASLDKMLSYDPKISHLPHYGVHKDAKRHINDYKRMIELAVSIVEENLDKSTNDIIRILAERDANIRKAISLVKGHKIWEGGIRRSIEGIKSYILWKQKHDDKIGH